MDGPTSSFSPVCRAFDRVDGNVATTPAESLICPVRSAQPAFRERFVAADRLFF